MTRVDIGSSNCHTVWDNEVRSSAVPMLSAPDGSIYTVNRIDPPATTPADGFEFTAANADTVRSPHTARCRPRSRRIRCRSRR